jgi:hypothetical protein
MTNAQTRESEGENVGGQRTAASPRRFIAASQIVGAILGGVAIGVVALASTLAASAPPADGQEATVGRVRDLGRVRFLPVIRGRDGGYSARFDGRSVWVFGDSPINATSVDGSRWRSATWGWTGNFDATRGVALTEPVDRKGTPGQFLPFTSAELSYNTLHDRPSLPDSQQSRWRVWPGPIVVDPRNGRALIFYSKVMAHNGPWAFEAMGASIALWDSVSQPRVRPEVARRSNDPTILFGEDDVPPAAGALAVGDSLNAYFCDRKGLAHECIVARVAFADALNRRAWRFFSGGDRWNEDLHAAVTVMKAASMLSVHWNEFLHRYLAVYGTPLVNTIEIRTAPRPEGPWSDSRVVVTGVTPVAKDTWDYCGMAHAELARDRGRVEYLTYCRDTGNFTSEVRLVEVTFK